MARHYNTSISERLLRIFNFKGADQIGPEVSGLVAVVPVTPSVREVYSADLNTSSASNTLKTLPAGKDFYLTGVLGAYVKDATCDAATGNFIIRIGLNGVTTTLISFPLITLTAQQGQQYVSFPFPIKVDSAALLSVAAPTFTVGVFKRSAAFYGYSEEVTAS